MSATRELQRRLLAEETQPRFEPCLPRPTKVPPSGPGWIHEIKHDGFRILAHRQGPTIRLITRNGYDFSDRFPFIVEAVAALPVRSCIVDGEAIAVDENGLSVFDLVRNRRQDDAVLLCAFDLLEVNGEDIRQDGIEGRKRRLAGLLRRPHDGMALNEHYRGDGAVIFKHACALGCDLEATGLTVEGHHRRFERVPGTSAWVPISDVLLSRSKRRSSCLGRRWRHFWSFSLRSLRSRRREARPCSAVKTGGRSH
jgi:bifunctional non-homologous end joining protein LigD